VQLVVLSGGIVSVGLLMVERHSKELDTRSKFKIQTAVNEIVKRFISNIDLVLYCKARFYDYLICRYNKNRLKRKKLLLFETQRNLLGK